MTRARQDRRNDRANSRGLIDECTGVHLRIWTSMAPSTRTSDSERLTPEGCWLLAGAGDQWHASVWLVRNGGEVRRAKSMTRQGAVGI